MLKGTTLLDTAARIAAAAHKEQVRKNDGSPYVVHVYMVGLMLMQRGFSETVVAAGIVHDVLEDTDFPEDEFRILMGNEVCAIVDAVRDDPSLPWMEKKKKYIETVRTGPEGAKAVCVVDKIHNAHSFLVSAQELGPDIWKKFNAPKEQKLWFERAVLQMLKESWDHPLIAEYEELVTHLEAVPE